MRDPWLIAAVERSQGCGDGGDDDVSVLAS